MKMNVHIIMGLNEDSLGPAKYLQRRHEVVYILDNKIKGVKKRRDFTFVDPAFVDAIDHTLFKVYIYEPPYKNARILRGSKSFILERRETREDDET